MAIIQREMKREGGEEKALIGMVTVSSSFLSAFKLLF